MSLSCSECDNQARFLCGHGCGTVYCAEECAKNAYNVHKNECVALVGDKATAWSYVNQGTAEQRYNNVKALLDSVWTAMQGRITIFNKGKIRDEKDTFIYVASNIMLQPDMVRYRNAINMWITQVQQQAAKLIGEEERRLDIDEGTNIDEGVIDIFHDENAFYKSFNLTKEMSRTNVIISTFGDLQETYEKHKKDLFKGNLKKKLQYFTGALRRLIQEKGDTISFKEKEAYEEFIRQVDVWIVSLSKK